MCATVRCSAWVWCGGTHGIMRACVAKAKPDEGEREKRKGLRRIHQDFGNRPERTGSVLFSTAQDTCQTSDVG